MGGMCQVIELISGSVESRVCLFIPAPFSSLFSFHVFGYTELLLGY